MTTRRDGLSTANFVSGAMQGFQFGEGIKDRNAHRERQEKMDGLREAEARRAEERFHMNKEAHANQLKRSESQEQRAAEIHGMNKRLTGIKADQLNQENLERMNRGLALSLAATDRSKLDPEDAQFLETHKNLDANRLMSPEYGKALETVDKVFAGEVDRNSPEAMEALSMIAPEIMDGAEKNVKPARILPGATPETFRVGLAVEGDPNIEPLTENRSSDGKDPVKEIPVDAVIQRVQTAKMMREKLQDPNFRNAFVQRWAPDALKGGSSQNDPASIRAADLYNQRRVAEGKEPLPFDRAFRAANTSLRDPVQFINDVTKQELDAQKEALVTPGDKGYRTLQQIRQDAIRQYLEIREALNGDKGYRTRQQIRQDAVRQYREIRDALNGDKGQQGARTNQPAPTDSGGEQFDNQSFWNEIMGSQSNNTTEPGTVPAQNPRDQAGRSLEEAPTQPGAASPDPAAQDAFFGRRPRQQVSDVDRFGRPNVF